MMRLYSAYIDCSFDLDTVQPVDLVDLLHPKCSKTDVGAPDAGGG